MEHSKNAVLVKVNDLFVVGSETINEGTTYLFDASEKPVKYHPALRLVFESKQFKQSPNMVGLPKMQMKAYTPREHMQKLQSRQELEGKFDTSVEVFVNLASECLAGDEADKKVYYTAKKKMISELVKLEEGKARKKISALTQKRKSPPKGVASVGAEKKRGKADW